MQKESSISRTNIPWMLFFILGCYAITRLWVFYSLPHSPYIPLHDSLGYLESSEMSLLNYHFWGSRPFAYPLFIKIVKLMGGTISTIFIVQTIFSSVAWFFLANIIRTQISNRYLSWVVFVSILTYSISGYLVIWDVKLLVDSFSISLLVIFIASFLILLKNNFQSNYLWVFVATSFVFSNIHDTNAYLVLLAGLVTVGFGLTAARRIFPLKQVKLLLLGTLIAFGFSYATAVHRWVENFCETLSYRLVDYKEASNYFLDHGFPSTPRMLNQLKITPYACVDCDYIEQNNPSGWKWLVKHGKMVYIKFLITHPAYTFNAYGFGDADYWHSLLSSQKDLYQAIAAFGLPGAQQKFVTSSNAVSVVSYSLPENKLVTMINTLACFAIPLFFIFSVILYLFSIRLNSRDPIIISALCLIIITIPLSLLVWHGDASGGFRHQLVNNVQLTLAFIVLAFKCFDNCLVGE